MQKKPDSKAGSNAEVTKSPNPRRVLARRLNRQKRGQLTPEGREMLRQSAHRNKSWRLSTGPKTVEGKAIVARNGKVRQKGPTSVREAKVEARAVRDMIHAMREARNKIET
jgi:hypothetical protein